MYKAGISVTLFKILGVWPSKGSKGCLTIYNIYTIFIAVIVVIFIISNSFYILKENIETDYYVENFFYSTAVFTASFKMLVIYWKRSKIREIIKKLYSNQFKPRDSKEKCIQNKFDRIGRFLLKFHENKESSHLKILRFQNQWHQ